MMRGRLGWFDDTERMNDSSKFDMVKDVNINCGIANDVERCHTPSVPKSRFFSF